MKIGICVRSTRTHKSCFVNLYLSNPIWKFFAISWCQKRTSVLWQSIKYTNKRWFFTVASRNV